MSAQLGIARRTWPAILAVAILAWPTPTKAAEPINKVGTIEGVTEYKLANGLRVVLIPDDSKPLITINNTVLVGSRHEGYGEGGMAHLLEHMCIKSTPTFPNIMKSVRDHNASSWNAITRHDATNFFETMPATDANLEFGIKLEADRMINCDLKREDLITEMTVVRSEFEKSENNAYAILGQRTMSAAFDWHNYGKTVIGNRSDIENYPIESLRAFYKKHYRVDNAVLAIGGKFDEKKTLDLIVKYFGPIKKPTLPLPTSYTREASADGERQVSLRRVGTVAATMALYHVPAASHEDFAAIRVLHYCLNMTPDGRLHEELVKTKKAVEADSLTFAFHDPGCLGVIASSEHPKEIDHLRDEMVALVENLKPITDAEVARVKQKYKSTVQSTFRSTKDFTVDLTTWIALGDWRLFFIDRDRVQQVTAADCNRVAATYLKRENRTVGTYYPAEKPVRVAVPDAPAIAKVVDGFRGGKGEEVGESFEPTPQNIEKRTTRGTLFDTNIKTAYLPRKTRGQDVNFSLTLRYGNEESLKGKDSAIVWMGAQFVYGTKNRTRRQLDDALTQMDATMSASGGNGWINLQGSTNREYLPATLKLIVEMLREPAFPEAEFSAYKRQQIENLLGSRNNPESLASIAASRKLFPHPRGHILAMFTVEEAIAEAQKTTLEDIKNVYAEQLGASDGELVVVGDFDAAQVEPSLAGLKGWKSKVQFRRLVNVGTPLSKGENLVIHTPDNANSVYLAKLVYPMKDDDADYAAMMVANRLLGGRADSRLFNKVRVANGLSYEINSRFSADNEDPSAEFTIRAITNPANMPKVKALVMGELEKFAKEGATIEDVEAAKKEIIEETKPLLSDMSNVVSVLRESLRVGYTMQKIADEDERVRKVTPEDVKRAFNRVVDANKLFVVEAGDFKK
jgi:zinc protease